MEPVFESYSLIEFNTIDREGLAVVRFYSCNACGALVNSRAQHEEWHKELENHEHA